MTKAEEIEELYADGYKIKIDNFEGPLQLLYHLIKEAKLDIEEVAIHIIKTMLKLYPGQIIARYNLNNTKDIIEILDQIGKKIGAIKNDETDY